MHDPAVVPAKHSAMHPQATSNAASITPHTKKAQFGQGMTEYIVIVALIAVAAIAVYQYFGQVVRSQTAGIANEVAGKAGATAIKDAGDAATEASKETEKKGLASYDGGADKAAAAKK